MTTSGVNQLSEDTNVVVLAAVMHYYNFTNPTITTCVLTVMLASEC